MESGEEGSQKWAQESCIWHVAQQHLLFGRNTPLLVDLPQVPEVQAVDNRYHGAQFEARRFHRQHSIWPSHPGSLHAAAFNSCKRGEVNNSQNLALDDLPRQLLAEKRCIVEMFR